LLTLRAPQWTSPGMLTEALWPDDQSASTESRLHLHVHRLRGRLSPGAIESGPDGFGLAVPSGCVVVWCFERAVGGVLADHGRGAADGEPAHSSATCSRRWSTSPSCGRARRSPT